MPLIHLEESIYKWLISMDIIPNEGKKTSNNKYQLPTNISAYLENGVLFGKLVLVLQK